MDVAKISVEGNGAIHIVPDVTRLEVKIEQWFAGYNEAYEQAKENSSWIVKILEYNKKPGTLAKTVRFNIEDFTENDYDDNGNYLGKIKNGFMLEQCFKVDLPIDNILVNCIVRGVGKYIANAQINIGYTLQDKRPAQLKMLNRAVKDAKEKATIMAEAGGCSLGKLLSINYGCHDFHICSQARHIHSNLEATASTPNSLDITPEDLVISDTVEVVWELVNP